MTLVAIALGMVALQKTPVPIVKRAEPDTLIPPSNPPPLHEREKILDALSTSSDKIVPAQLKKRTLSEIRNDTQESQVPSSDEKQRILESLRTP